MAADNNCGSQESLPLSQESYQQLCSLIQSPLSNLMEQGTQNTVSSDKAYDALFSDISRAMPKVEPIYCSSDSVPSPILREPEYIPRHSSLPACENWPGVFSFSVSFNHQTATKGISWIFSSERNKLYVTKDVPCPVNFSTNTFMPEDFYIRAMALFSSSDHASENVTRCVNHSIDEIKKNISEAEHFIRSESSNAIYQNDPVNGRHSVLVPYENPPAGQRHSTYLFKFMCFGSCAGGPNRRSMCIIFTLERGCTGEVLGRQKVDLKVCACPVRDYKSDNKSTEVEKKPTKRYSTDLLPMIKSPKKVKEENKEKEYCIKTTDKQCYKFLRKMQMIYSVYNTVKNEPSWKQALGLSFQSSSYEETDVEMNVL